MNSWQTAAVWDSPEKRLPSCERMLRIQNESSASVWVHLCLSVRLCPLQEHEDLRFAVSLSLWSSPVETAASEGTGCTAVIDFQREHLRTEIHSTQSSGVLNKNVGKIQSCSHMNGTQLYSQEPYISFIVFTVLWVCGRLAQSEDDIQTVGLLSVNRHVGTCFARKCIICVLLMFTM